MITPDGDYLSNPQAYDLRPHFKHLHWRVMGHSQGHLVASDWADQDEAGPYAFYKNCGLWTRDEASILMKTASRTGGEWVDIGAHTGWTSKHINWGTNREVVCVDPMLRDPLFAMRFRENTGFGWWAAGCTSDMLFSEMELIAPNQIYRGFCIDGDHEPGEPLKDAKNALKHLAPSGTIVFHDGIGRPVREAVTFLLDNGFKARMYWTPHIVFVCWRGDKLEPVDHVTDPRIDWRPHRAAMAKDFDFGRLS